MKYKSAALSLAARRVVPLVEEIGEILLIRWSKWCLTPFIRISLLSVVIASMNSCASSGVREHVERQMNDSIGKLRGQTIFHDGPAVTCKGRNGENGCLLKSRDTGCTIWFNIDKEDRVVSWEYVGRPENCWEFHGR